MTKRILYYTAFTIAWAGLFITLYFKILWLAIVYVIVGFSFGFYCLWQLAKSLSEEDNL